ncbi:MAG: hypothetical protein MZV64_09150 [Ignavibacteriales bacterium]|nr:hypothetical protein [Ignavibacteriales bacterium]
MKEQRYDVGKIGIPESILNKVGPLTRGGMEIMKTPGHWRRDLRSLGGTLGQTLDIIRHHEKLDGSSYPDGQKGSEISMVSRIMAVVDIYDALTTDRPIPESSSRRRSIHDPAQGCHTGQAGQCHC